MDPITAGLNLINTVSKMIGDARNASAEKSADIAARFAAAESSLVGAQQDAHDTLRKLEEAAKQG